MNEGLMQRAVIVVAFVISILIFVMQMLMGYELLQAAFTSMCVMFATSIILMIAVQGISQVLMRHLSEQQRAAAEQTILENELKQAEEAEHEDDNSNNCESDEVS